MSEPVSPETKACTDKSARSEPASRPERLPEVVFELAILPGQIRNLTDPEPKRATFGLRYPLEDLTFRHRSDFERLPKEQPEHEKRTCRGWRLGFQLPPATCHLVSFEGCNFHNRKGQSTGEIDRLTFRKCDFLSSIMGTTRYHLVRFAECRFERCDFAHAHFDQCIFENCVFVRCTGEQVTFDRTAIAPDAFLKGISFPDYNFSKETDDVKKRLRDEWLEIRARLAAELVHSLGTLQDAGMSDRALYLYRQAEAERLRPKRKARWLLSRVGVELTGGGTSLGRLCLLLLILNALLLVVLHWGGARHDGRPLLLDSVRGAADAYLAVFTLMFGWGFSTFSADGPSLQRIILVAPAVGLVWIGLVIPVLVRRVYR